MGLLSCSFNKEPKGIRKVFFEVISNEIHFVVSCSNKLIVEIGELLRGLININLSLEELDILSLFHCTFSMKDENIKKCGNNLSQMICYYILK